MIVRSFAKVGQVFLRIGVLILGLSSCVAIESQASSRSLHKGLLHLILPVALVNLHNKVFEAIIGGLF